MKKLLEAINRGLLKALNENNIELLTDLDDIEIEVYDFDPNVPCELYKSLENIVAMKNISMSYLEEVSSIKARYWIKIFDAVNNPTINSLNN